MKQWKLHPNKAGSVDRRKVLKGYGAVMVAGMVRPHQRLGKNERSERDERTSTIWWTPEKPNHQSPKAASRDGYFVQAENGRSVSLVLATVPGYPAAVLVSIQTGWSSPGCNPENRGTHRVRGQVWTGPRFHFTVPTTLAPIKYLSFDCIMTWSIRKLFSFSRSSTSSIQICSPTDIRWMVVN